MSFIVTPGQFTQRAEFYHQLAQFTSAGIGVVPALEKIRRGPPARSFREPLQRILDELALGRTVTESLRRLSWLPEFDIALIEAGERSGRLDACFRLLSDYYEDRAKIAKQVISQLIYPVGLIHFAVFVFMIVLPWAGSQFNASLILLFAKAALVLSPLYIITIFLIYATQNKHGEQWRARIESFASPIPILGTARRFLALARLAAALEALISAGVNIIEAWDLAATASGSPALRRAVEKWKPQVVAGRTPAEVVHEHREFPEMFANLYSTGEVSGKLDEALKRLYSHYNEEGTRKLHAFAQWTPRLVYLLVAGIIAYKVIMFYTGYFQQVNDMSHF
ncbi:MAG TPA: type II secretion system F family protein [Candidatus Paceibacterota bacterium]|nr:type II secretion system F family protein [Candidatus Paceibacterota bacterium]